MKTKLALVLLLMGMLSVPAWSNVCSVVLNKCNKMVCLVIPPGGSCVTSNNQGYSGSATTYTSTGALHQSVWIGCPNTLPPSLP